SLKLRFACSRLPWFPAIYRLQVYDESFVRWRWTCVMPFWKPGTGPFDFEMFGWDVLELRFLWCFLNPEMVFLDIGAYHGIYSVLAAKKLAGNCRVVAFEPNPKDCARLHRHLALNSCKNVEVMQIALDSQSGVESLFIPVGGVKTISSLRR